MKQIYRGLCPNLEHTKNFYTLTGCIEYLSKLGFTINRDTLTKYIKKEKIFHNFLCKYSDSTLPIDFEEVGLIIDEYKKLKVNADLVGAAQSLKINIKNKPILVEGKDFQKEFESITDTIKYFTKLNIKLDRTTLNIRLKDGKIYKNYYFFIKI